MSIITDVYARSLDSRGNPTLEVYTESGAFGAVWPLQELLLVNTKQ